MGVDGLDFGFDASKHCFQFLKADFAVFEGVEFIPEVAVAELDEVEFLDELVVLGFEEFVVVGELFFADAEVVLGLEEEGFPVVVFGLEAEDVGEEEGEVVVEEGGIIVEGVEFVVEGGLVGGLCELLDLGDEVEDALEDVEAIFFEVIDHCYKYMK